MRVYQKTSCSGIKLAKSWPRRQSDRQEIERMEEVGNADGELKGEADVKVRVDGVMKGQDGGAGVGM
jgi:hypothetical protein